MVQRGYEATSSFDGFAKVVVATDNNQIADFVKQFGGEVEMTHPNPSTGTDRVAERYPKMSVVVNRGQPVVTAFILEQVVGHYMKEIKMAMKS